MAKTNHSCWLKITKLDIRKETPSNFGHVLTLVTLIEKISSNTKKKITKKTSKKKKSLVSIDRKLTQRYWSKFFFF